MLADIALAKWASGAGENSSSLDCKTALVSVKKIQMVRAASLCRFNKISHG